MTQPLKHKIRWALVTKFLKVTESTPQQLLDWLEWVFKNVPKYEFICLIKLYLDKYFIDDSFDETIFIEKSCIDRLEVCIPSLITGLYYKEQLYAAALLWDKLHDDIEFRKEMIDKFKKHYKLK